MLGLVMVQGGLQEEAVCWEQGSPQGRLPTRTWCRCLLQLQMMKLRLVGPPLQLQLQLLLLLQHLQCLQLHVQLLP